MFKNFDTQTSGSEIGAKWRRNDWKSKVVVDEGFSCCEEKKNKYQTKRGLLPRLGLLGNWDSRPNRKKKKNIITVVSSKPL